MAWSRSQFASADPAANNTSLAITFSSAVAANSLIVVSMYFYDATHTVSSITDNATGGTNTYHQGLGPIMSGTSMGVGTYYSFGTKSSSSLVVTVNMDSTSDFLGVIGAVYTSSNGGVTSDPKDGTGSATGTSAAPSCTVTTSGAGRLLWGAAMSFTPTTPGQGTGFTSVTTTTSDMYFAEQNLSSASGSNAVASTLTASDGWIIVGVGFAEPAGGGLTSWGDFDQTSSGIYVPRKGKVFLPDAPFFNDPIAPPAALEFQTWTNEAKSQGRNKPSPETPYTGNTLGWAPVEFEDWSPTDSRGKPPNPPFPEPTPPFSSLGWAPVKYVEWGLNTSRGKPPNPPFPENAYAFTTRGWAPVEFQDWSPTTQRGKPPTPPFPETAAPIDPLTVVVSLAEFYIWSNDFPRGVSPKPIQDWTPFLAQLIPPPVALEFQDWVPSTQRSKPPLRLLADTTPHFSTLGWAPVEFQDWTPGTSKARPPAPLPQDPAFIFDALGFAPARFLDWTPAAAREKPPGAAFPEVSTSFSTLLPALSYWSGDWAPPALQSWRPRPPQVSSELSFKALQPPPPPGAFVPQLDIPRRLVPTQPMPEVAYFGLRPVIRAIVVPTATTAQNVIAANSIAWANVPAATTAQNIIAVATFAD